MRFRNSRMPSMLSHEAGNGALAGAGREGRLDGRGVRQWRVVGEGEGRAVRDRYTQRSLKRIVVLRVPPCADGLKRHWRTAATVAPLKTPGGLAEITRTLVTAPDGATE